MTELDRPFGPVRDEGLGSWFRAGHDRAPHGIAFRAGSTQLTFDEVHRRALELAGAIVQVTGGAPARVGVLAGASATAHVGLLGVIFAGAAAVPLSDRFPVHRTLAVVAAARIDIVVVDEASRAVLERLTAEMPGLRALTVSAGRLLADDPAAPADAVPLTAPVPTTPDALAYIMFTSGSTGVPKGVPITHGNALHFARTAQRRHRIDAQDVLVQTSEPTFDLFMFGFLLAWGAGAGLVALPPQALRRLPDFLRRHGVTFWFSVPSTIRLLRRLGALTPGSLSSLTRSVFCGEPLTCADAEDWQRAAPDSVIENLYGPTELTVSCTAERWQPQESDAGTGNGFVPIGRLHDGLRAVLLDDELRPVADAGELAVTGPQMFGGYLNPEDDRDRFVDLRQERWYRTGDRARRLDDGRFAYLGRLDDQVKIRGYRVEISEIERCLREIDGVTEAVVVVTTDDGESKLVAFYVGAAETGAGLAGALSQRLPEYMVPRAIERVAELPHNVNGKVDRIALRRQAVTQRL